MNKKILTIVLSVLIITLIIFTTIQYYKQNQTVSNIPQEEAVNRALNYINKNLLQGGMNAALVQIYESEEDTPYYTFQFNAMGQKYDSVVTADGSRLFVDTGIDLNEKMDEKVDGNFRMKESAEIIKEDGKPVVYLFTSSSCPHCAWEKPVLEEVADKFKDNVVLKIRENTPEDQDVYNKFGKGGVPLVVLGGKYYREGAGENLGEEKEKEYLTKYICELTGNIPEDICNK